MNKSESKYFNTAMRMDEALLSLLEEKEYQYITVTEICKRADVNRSTFYLHYETVDDLLTETLTYTMDRFHETFRTLDLQKPEQIETLPLEELILISPAYLVPYLEFTRENRRIFVVAASQPNTLQVGRIFGRFYLEWIYPIMKRFGIDESEIQYRLAFYLQGIFAVICKWIQNGFQEDAQTMADLLIRCVFPSAVLPEEQYNKDVND